MNIIEGYQPKGDINTKPPKGGSGMKQQWDDNETQPNEPILTIEDKKYNIPLVIYAPDGSKLVDKEGPDKIPFGFKGE